MPDLHNSQPSDSTQLPTAVGVGIRVPAVVFDCDGVLCDSSNQIHEARAGGAVAGADVDWHEWNQQDFGVIAEYVALANTLFDADVAVIILTSRQEISREVTSKWLVANKIPHDELIMRPMDHDYHTWKADAIKALLAGAYDIKLMLEDSHGHAESVRACGVPVIHVVNQASHL